MKKHVVALTLLALLGGCATVPPIAVSNLDKSESVVVKDLRPAREKDSKFFSLLITSEQYGLMRVNAETLSPSTTRLLQHRAYEQLKQDGQPLSIEINHLVVYRNMQTEGRRAAIGGAFGIIGALVVGLTAPHGSAAGTSSLTDADLLNSTDEKEWQLATCAKADNPTDAIVFIVFADTVIDGKRVVTRTVHPLEKEHPEKALPDAVDQAINFHISQYVKS